MTTSIDLSQVPPPAAIQVLSFEEMNQEYVDRFVLAWAQARTLDGTLPDYDVQMLETDPAIIIGQAWTYLRLLDRQRVNDAVASVLAPLATGTNLDNVVARQGVQRLVVVPANDATGAAAVLETDAQLLRRYLLSFDRPAAGSRDGLLYAAYSAWPGMHHARINGHAVHGRRGDTDVVIIGPGGRLATSEEKAAITAAVYDPSVAPEAISIAVLDAQRQEYDVSLVIEVPQGPDANLIKAEAVARIRLAADERTVIGGEVPFGYLPGAAYGAGIIKVRDLSPVHIEPDPYVVPILIDINIAIEVRT